MFQEGVCISLLQPPVHENTIGVKDTCSICQIRSSYFHFFLFIFLVVGFNATVSI